jgi:membrane protein implicated in regulation of membrane protease activity
MTSFVQPLLADVLVNGMALLSVSIVGYLLWLRFLEQRPYRNEQSQRERQRRGHWGYL